MGTAKAWFPSRRSTLHQMGGRVSVRFGQCRSGNWIGGKGRYLLDGFLIMLISVLIWRRPAIGQTKNPTADWQWGFRNCRNYTRTPRPRRPKAAHLLAAGSDLRSQSKSSNAADSGQPEF